VAFVVLMPPLQVPDEIRHLGRAFLITEGQFLPESVRGRARARVPQSLAGMEQRLGPRIARHPRAKQRVSRVLREFSQPLEPEVRVLVKPRSFYSPVVYLPQAVGVGIARLLGLPPIVHLYLGRLVNLAASIALIWLALRQAPAQRWLLVLLALTPMSLSLGASLSADAATNALSFLFIASVLRSSQPGRGEIPFREVGVLLVLAMLVSLTKQSYWPLVGITVLVPASRFRGSGHRLACLALWVIGSVVPLGLWWSQLQGLAFDPLLPDSDPSEQVAHLFAQPLAFAGVLEATCRKFLLFWLDSFIGVLGYVDTPLPRWIYLAYWPALLTVALVDGGRSPVRSRGRLALLAVAALCWIATMLAGYLGWSPVGGDHVVGMQGRYFIPFAPLLFLALHLGENRSLPRWGQLGLVGFCAVVLSTSLARVVLRYYVS
jgi:uncharacterized membrane protein